jgi:hypothetical protein
METRENEEKYISISKQNIDNFLTTYQYRKAFWLLILFLERLHDKDKVDVIDYYSKNMKQLGIFNNTYVLDK